MNIRTMTANFGGLENETMTLQPGFQVVRLPNGGGKTTWCAFLEAMFYGLADSNYVPRNGGPMSGKMELLWNDRPITLERDFTAGTFRAYETLTREPIAQLTAENCGRRLTGLDRAGYLSLFGEEGPEERHTQAQRLLEKGLTEGQDQCRRQLQQTRDSLAFWKKSRQDRTSLENNRTQLENRRLEAENFRLRLEHHLYALDHSAGAQQTQEARADYERCLREQEALEALAKTLPTREETRKRLENINSFCAAWTAVQNAKENLGQEPRQPSCPEAFRGLDLRQIQQKAEEDTAVYRDSAGSPALILLMLGLLGLLTGCIAAFPMQMSALGLAVMGLGVLALAGAVLFCGRGKNRLAALGAAYGTPNWRLWPKIAQSYIKKRIAYEESLGRWNTRKKAICQRLQELEQQKKRLCEGREPEEMKALCAQVEEKWEALEKAKQRTQSAKARLDSPVQPEGELWLTKKEAEKCLGKTKLDLWQLQEDLEGVQATLESLETAGALDAKVREAEERERKLAGYEKAYALSLNALKEAGEKIENRGKREVEGRTKEYFAAVVGTDETRFLSGGDRDTAELARCLAKAKIYAKDVPLLLDDVLARLDDERMQKAVTLLKKEDRQIVLFTCRNREAEAAKEGLPTPAAEQQRQRHAMLLPAVKAAAETAKG